MVHRHISIVNGCHEFGILHLYASEWATCCLAGGLALTNEAVQVTLYKQKYILFDAPIGIVVVS